MGQNYIFFLWNTMPEINIAPIPVGKLGQTPKMLIFVKIILIWIKLLFNDFLQRRFKHINH